jgi:hypothetical protein
MINVEFKYPKIPDISFKGDLKKIADDIFIPYLKKYIRDEVSIDGSAYGKLAESTIRSKEKKGLSANILQATGKLYKSFYSSERVNSKKVVITLNPGRKEIGNILQNKGVKYKTIGFSGSSSLRYFNFFGVSEVMNRKAILYMRNKIKDLCAGFNGAGIA